MNGLEMPGDKSIVKVIRDLEEIDIPNIVLIVVSAWALMKVIERFFPWLAERLPVRFRFYILPMVPVLRLVIIIATVVLLVPEIIQPKFENLVAIMSAIGVAVGFAFKDYISSLAAGMVAVYERPYRPGDWVKIGDAYGEVKAVEARALRMVTLDDAYVTIPHKKIWDSSVFNQNNARRELQCIADFYLFPKHNGAAVRQKLVEVALTSPYLQIDLPVMVVAQESPYYTHYKLKAYPVEGRDQQLFITDLTIRGKEALALMGVEPAMPWFEPPRGVEEET